MATEVIGTLLTVEDETEIRQLTAMYAESLGFKVLEAEDGQVAIDLLKTHPVDIIVSDMKMPRKDGMTLLKELRDSGDFTPFLFLSAFTTREYTVQALSLGAFDYLEKPFLANDLKALLHEMLRVAKGQKKALDHAGLLQQASMISSGKVPPEAEILRIATMNGDSEKSIAGLAASGGVDRNERLRKLFADEAQSQLNHASRALADLRHTESPGWQLGYLFRVMYSIKSTAGSLSLKDIRDLSETIERTYVLLRIRTSFLSKLTLASLSAAHEVLRRHLDQLRSVELVSEEDKQKLQSDTQQILLELEAVSRTPSKHTR